VADDKPQRRRTPVPRWVWWQIVLVFVSVLGIAIAGAAYTNASVRQEDRRVRAAIVAEGQKLCAVFTLLDSSYQRTPPVTAAGKAFAAVIHKVTADLGCR